ncbi:MAG: zinc ABC transporter substrate-binding protein [Rhodospirillales bacterium]|nr:zinc ABC transporter substrate-binding protein [Rhodospirillales bacterium]MDE2199034.1 zinc ABC transporter substrate-binding protein [Rhodospirillales bacterium]MDE2575909.1 zinc ABC transporter substrate-binding protein [Rhodospirillales bacterium]
MRAVLLVLPLAGLLAGLPAAWPRPARAAPAPIGLVAAENVYGDVAAQIGGAEVRVTSVLANPSQDPHLFEASPSVARAVSAARIVVANGLGYDPWMGRLAAAAGAPGRVSIVVADLLGRKPGDNPHVWYDPAAMPAFARALTAALCAIDPPHAGAYQARLARFTRSLAPIASRIAELRTRFAGTPVTATEPVFGTMFAALGLRVRNTGFQIAVMNGTEPSAADMAAFERDLRGHAVRLLVFNRQASSPIAERMARLAREQGIAVLGVTETEPPGTTYQAWIAGALDAVARALAGPAG